ncbi:hypothetical protein BKA66DRAFT_552412 [Pyrenochaeta sp. MPI-SDFR-AT-0127]|nr:hypothetical protein BKA66DRAFT_552412 [Pyrenochaeta sp. MPI-SDFR-AT-0127]
MASNSIGTEFGSNSSQDAERGSLRTQRKRQLDLVKCERCRMDKQKCLPTRRVWPTKCNRCIVKGHPCSEGRRVDRGSKHRPERSSLPTSAATNSIQMQGLKDHLRHGHMLLTYHKNITMATDRLRTLKENATKLFFDIRHTVVKIGEGELFLQSFYEQLETMMFKFTKKLLTINQHTPHLPVTLLSDLSAQVLTTQSLTRTCPVCIPSDQEKLMKTLEQMQGVYDEFLARQYRLVKHFDADNHTTHLESNKSLVSHELARYRGLSAAFILRAHNSLELLGMHEAATMCPQIGLYHPDAIGAHLFTCGEKQQDCLGRTNMHCWLDAMSRDPGQADLDLLQPRNLRTATTLAINTRDILGRSPLHIACQNGWMEGVEALLKLGADPVATTIYGTSPLHYAAANGSAEMCKLLLGHATVDEARVDGQGQTAVYYALKKQHTEAARVLSSFHGTMGRRRPMRRIELSVNANPGVRGFSTARELGFHEDLSLWIDADPWKDFSRVS